MWILTYLKSSIGRKQTMGVAGALLVGFLVGHLLGNLQLLNPNPAAAQTAYNAYTKFLTGLSPLLQIIECGLVAILAWHVAVASWLKLQNLKSAGTSRYAVSATVGPATPASYTMYCSGSIIFVFIVLHLAVFKFGTYYLFQDAKGDVIRDMWLTTVQFFAHPLYTALYVAALLVIGLHLFHAIPSLFRTFGLDHPKWTPAFTVFGWLVAAALGLGFAGTAVGTCVLAHTDAGKAQIQKALDAQPALAQLKK